MTVVALLEDGIGGTYRHIAATDEGLRAFTSAIGPGGASVAPIYSGDIKEIGGFAHTFALEGAPYMTLGAYVRSESQGIVRFPTVMIENVSSLAQASLLIASVVGDDAMPYLAEAIPHTYGLATPDASPLLAVGAIGLVLAASAPALVLGTAQSQDGAQSAVNLPPELYMATGKIGADAAMMFIPLFFGTSGLPAPATASGAYAEDWTNRPEVRAWTMRKTAAGHEAWKGVYLERTGSSNGGPAGAFVGTKRVETGVATRLDGATTHVAGVYVQLDAERAASNTTLATHARYTVGATAADTADAPIAAIEMEEARSDSVGNLHFLPASQQNDWRLGVYAGEDFIPLVGARTRSTHAFHADVNNLGQPVTEIETERITSVGAYALDTYVPIVGARYWGERLPLEMYALLVALSGLGDQNVGDIEMSVGTFLLDAYTPVAGARIDDDFALHHHAYRSMISAGGYALGTFTPVVGSTYDGERPSTVWAFAMTNDNNPDADKHWQTSAGAIVAGTYVPVVGTRFAPHTWAGQRAEQESYQVGIYLVSYSTFMPLVGVDYASGDTAPRTAARILDGAILGVGREHDTDVDLVAYGPDGAAIPVIGVQYRTSAPDMPGPYSTHVAIGVYQGTAFTPLAGASFRGDAYPVGIAQALGAANARVSIGTYPAGVYAPLATIDSATIPR